MEAEDIKPSDDGEWCRASDVEKLETELQDAILHANDFKADCHRLESDLEKEREALREVCEGVVRAIDDKVTMLTYEDRILFEKLEEQVAAHIERLKGV